MKTALGDITLSTIKEAYEATGYTPRTGLWLRSEEGELCGCAITAFVKHKTGTLPNSLTPQNFADTLGISRQRLHAFTDGFDGINDTHFYLADYLLGLAVRREVFGLPEEQIIV